MKLLILNHFRSVKASGIGELPWEMIKNKIIAFKEFIAYWSELTQKRD